MVRAMDGATSIIVGAGPLGIALAHHLSGVGVRVAFLQRRFPPVLEGYVGETPFRYEPASSAYCAQTDAVFFTVKAFDLQNALAQHLPQFPDSVPVISLGNGAIDEILESASQNFPHAYVRAGISTVGARATSASQYQLTDGQFVWGPVRAEQARTEFESWLVKKAPSLFVWQDNPWPLLHKKWLFNVVINSLTGSQRLAANAQLLQELPRVELVFREALALGEKEWGPWTEAPTLLFQELLSLIEKTASNENSMARDVRLGRRTETEFLAGLAEAHPEFPVLRKLHSKLMLP